MDNFKGSGGYRNSGQFSGSTGINTSTGINSSTNSLSPTLPSHDGLLNEDKITRVLNKIPDQYHRTDFGARKVALDYMRSTNRKDLLDQVEKWLDDLNDVTDEVVDVYFQGFNKSIHNYSRILQFMGDSHTNALAMSKEVEEVNKLIYFNNANIGRLWRRNLEYYYQIKILEKMEELKKVPELLDKYLNNNHFVHASNLLVNSTQALNERDLVNINALSDLKQYLNEKREMFNDMIVDRLNDHIYQKSIIASELEEDDSLDFKSMFKKATANESSNTSTTNNKSNSSKLNGKDKDKANSNINSNVKLNGVVKLTRNKEKEDNEPLQLEEQSKNSNSIEDLTINPESNSKLFMNLLIESLSVLQYLDPAVGLILGKISIELKSIITNSSTLVTQVYQSEGRTIAKIPGEATTDDHQQNIMFLNESFNRNELLSTNTLNMPLVDLMNAIFKKVLLVFKNHMTLSIVVNDSIKKRNAKRRRERVMDEYDEILQHNDDNTSDTDSNSLNGSGIKSNGYIYSESDLYSLPLVWEIIQKEIREMLRIHLHDTSSLLMSSSMSSSNNNANDNSKSSSRLFSFSNSIITDSWNGSSSPSLSSTGFPMSVGGAAGAGGSALTSSGGITQGGIGIFKASPYNVTPIYPLITKFTDQIDSLLSGKKESDKEKDKLLQQQQSLFGSRDTNDTNPPRGLLRMYIDDFVHRNFLQHIKSDYKERVTAAIEGPDAFKPLERFRLVYRLRDTKPVLNSTLQIFQFITELFSDIVAMSHYSEEFGAIIQTSLLRYYEKCLSKFNQEVEPTVTGALLNTDLFKYILNSLDSKKQQEIPDFKDSKEEEYEFKTEADLFSVPEKPIFKNQLILDLEKLTMIANLYHSLEWLAQKVNGLFSLSSTQSTTQSATTSTIPETPSKSSKQPLKTPKALNQKNLITPELMEVLRPMELSIKDITMRFRELAKRCLIALRIEYRIHCFYFFEGFKKASYLCEEERTDPDSFIVELNKDLSMNEETMSTYLTSDKCQFLFGGIAKLIGKLLISKLVHVKQINSNGVAKLCKNVYTLQQNLTNIIVKREIFFDRIRQFYQSLANEDELLQYLLEKMVTPYFSIEEAKIIIDFLQTTKRVSSNTLQTLDAKFKNMFCYASWNDTVLGGFTCRFAKKYTTNDILNDHSARIDFVQSILHFEGNFHSHMVGINVNSSLTLDGNRVNYTTGNVTNNPRKYTAASKESLHIAMLALGLNGKTSEGYDPLDYFHYPIEFTSAERKLVNTGDARLDNVLVLLYRKMNSIEAFNQDTPGYGGFIPWTGVNNTNIDKGPPYNDTTVPSLDNGEMVWGIYAVQYLLRTKYPQHIALGNRYRSYFNMLSDNANLVFLNETKQLYRGSAVVPDSRLPVKSNIYSDDSNYVLGDAFEGELFILFSVLFGKWDNQTLRENVWKNIDIYQRVYNIPNVGNLTYQQGWTYSSHESWKYLMAPYTDVPIQKKILSNCEKARTWFSKLNNYPGLYGAAYMPNVSDSTYSYYTGFGVGPLAHANIREYGVFTPYGAFPVILANHSIGLSWYHNILLGSKMQGPYGSTESGTNNGTMIAPFLSWDTKASVIAILGGIGSIVRDALKQDNMYTQFLDRINSTYSQAFNKPFLGESIPFAAPPQPPQNKMADFTLCDDYIPPTTTTTTTMTTTGDVNSTTKISISNSYFLLVWFIFSINFLLFNLI